MYLYEFLHNDNDMFKKSHNELRTDMKRFSESFPKELYGFENMFVTLRPYGGELLLAENCKEEYAQLLSQKHAKLDEVLETVGHVVNDSINFNPTTLVAHHTFINQPRSAKRYKAKPFEYDPKKPLIGKCDDAGHFIRLALNHIGISGLRAAQANKIITIPYEERGQGFSETMDHDVTLVTYEGRWGIVNSLSPYLEQNYVKAEDLDEFYPLILDEKSALWDYAN